MAPKRRRIALILDLQWLYKWHSEIFAGIQQYATKQGWISIIDEFAHDTLRHKQQPSDQYDGIVAEHTLAFPYEPGGQE